MSGRQRRENPWDWSQVTHAEAVARLFPEVADCGVPVDDFMPGRSWKAGEKPPIVTPLDDKVAELLARRSRPMLLPSERLAANGIRCPFYAIRYHAAVAIRHANDTSFAFSSTRIKQLTDEREMWRRRAAGARVLLRKHSARDAIAIGSLHLNSKDIDLSAQEETLADRNRRYQDLANEAGRDDRIIATIDMELQRLDCLRGPGTPDAWSTPFFVYMANLWTVLTGEPVPDAGTHLTDLLRIVTKVAGGDANQIREWGQARTLRTLFKDAPIGEGFRIGEADWFCGENEDAVLERGRAIRDLAEIMHTPEVHGSLKSAAACGAFILRDHEDEPLALIMREAVLRPLLTGYGLLPLHLEAQLGWLNKPTSTKIENELQNAFASAKAGDPAAAAVLEVAYACERSAYPILASLGWSEPAAGFTRSALNVANRARDNLEIEGPFRNGATKAFDAAMAIINAVPNQETTLAFKDISKLTSFGCPAIDYEYEHNYIYI